MILCRYVGGDCSELADREFDTVGQRATLSEQGFLEAVIGGAPFIPEKDFLNIGFTETELMMHGPSGSRFDPPQEFNNKLLLAQRIFADVRGQILKDPHQILAEIFSEEVVAR